MSSEGRGSREWRFYLDDVIHFAERVQTYTNGMNQSEFVADQRTFDATLCNLALIGEQPATSPAPSSGNTRTCPGA